MHPVWRAFGRPRAERLVHGADLVHALGGLPPPTRKPLVLTIHDLLPLTDPQFFTPRIRAEAARVAAAAATATVVLTTCRATAREIARLTGLPDERIIVAGLGPRETVAARVDAVPPRPYLLTVGAVTPRKGLDVLAEAVAALGPAAPAVLVAGPDGLYASRAHAAVAAHDTHHRFSFLGEVDDERLVALIANATLVCQPSRAEGFGMVCLEAMALGAPVIASDIASVREIAGDDALALTPAGDAGILAGELGRLLADDDARRALTEAGRARAQQYSWDDFATAVVGAYERALSASTFS
jgi:glycosyltransferase involved in cell wall biosynthesis